jgi:hypothetical protein
MQCIPGDWNGFITIDIKIAVLMKKVQPEQHKDITLIRKIPYTKLCRNATQRMHA